MAVDNSGGTRNFVLEILCVNYIFLKFFVCSLLVDFTVFEMKCTLCLCKLPTTMKGFGLFWICFFLYTWLSVIAVLLLIQPLYHCITAADRAALIKSIHAIMLKAISVPVLTL